MKAKKTVKCQYYYNYTFYDLEENEEDWLLVTLQYSQNDFHVVTI